MADMGQMDADLVGAAGFQPAGEQARHRLAVGAGIALQHLPMGDRPRGRPSRTAILSRACGWRPSGASTVPLRPVRHAPDEGEIAALQRAGAAVIGELRGQPPVRAVGLGDDHQAGGVLVEPVHDARPLHAADAGQAVAAMGDQRVDQRARPVAGGRMHDEAARLVDDDEVVVLVDDGERDGLAFGLRRLRPRGTADGDRLAGVDAVAGIADRAPADRDFAVEDEGFQSRPRQIADFRREEAVEPFTRLALGDDDFSLRSCVTVMTHQSSDDEAPLDPAAARIVAKVRWLMLISGLATVLGIAVVIGVIGYRFYRVEGSAATAAEVTARLPKGAKIVGIAVAGDRIAVTVDNAGTIEILTFDVRTLKAAGRLKFATEP